MRAHTPCLVAFVLAACRAPEAPAPPPLPSRDLRLARHGHRLARVDDTLYAFGGYGAATGRDKRRTLAFRLPDGPWKGRADMVHGRSFFGSGVIDGALYAVGSGSIERYDAAADEWTVVVTAATVPRSHFATAVANGRLHVLGGYPAGNAGHRVFDPVTGRVERAPAPPGYASGDHLHVMAAVGGRVHVVGGIGGGDFGLLDAHHAWDGARWIPCARPPKPLWAKFAAVAVVERTLYVFAMEGSFAYDDLADAWRPVTPLPHVLAMPGTTVLDGRIVVVGGRPVDGTGYAVYVYDPATDRWTSR